MSNWFSWLRAAGVSFPTPPEAPKLSLPEPLHIPTVQEFGVSVSGVAFIQHHEGLRLSAYLDSAGIPTIGYGTIRIYGKPVELGMTCTPAQANEWLTYECNGIARALQRIVINPLNQNQIDSLVDFCYNLGTDAFRGSTLCRTINLKQPLFADLFTRWNKIHKDGQVIEVPGLTARRKDEYTLYTS